MLEKADGWHGKDGSKWKTMPEVMLKYRAAAFFARTECPEALMGVQTTDEIIDAEYTVIDPKQGRFADVSVDSVQNLLAELKSEIETGEVIEQGDEE